MDSLKCDSLAMNYAKQCSLKLRDQDFRPPATISFNQDQIKKRGGLVARLMSPLKKVEELGDVEVLRDDDENPAENGGHSRVARYSSNMSEITECVHKDDDLSEKMSVGGLIPSKIHNVIAKKPKFDGRLIPMSDDHNATRYSTAVFPWHVKMCTALGVEGDSVVTSFKKRKMLCDRALEHFLQRNKDCQAKYALEFERLLIKKMNSRFMTMHSLLDNWLQPHTL